MRHLPALCLFAVATTACGTLFNAKVKTVTMVSTPDQAEVWIDGIMRGVTPLSLELDNHESHTVVFRKEDHSDVACELNSSAGVLWIVLDILGGLIPIIVDAATGDWNGIDQNACDVVLPTSPAADPPRSTLTEMARENGWVIFR